MHGWTSTTGMELQEKDERDIVKLFKKKQPKEKRCLLPAGLKPFTP